MAETDTRTARAQEIEVREGTEALLTVQSVHPLDRLPMAPTLALREDAEAIASRAVAMARGMRLAAIVGLTQPEDWVLSRDRQGSETAFLAASGVAKIKAPYGLYRHAVEGGTLEPRRIILPADGDEPERKGWTLRFVGGSRFLNLEDEMEATRWDHEKFLGREDIPSDPKKATEQLSWSLIARNLIGLRGVPAQELKECGIDVSRCRKGSGYGTAGQRGAEKVQAPDVAAEAQKIWTNILQRVAGDEQKAGQVLFDITVSVKEPPKYGIRSHLEFFKMDQFQYAWGRLKKHPEFGDQAGGGA